MPIHPFHWGVAGLLAPITRNRLDLTSLILGATLQDIDVIVLAHARGRIDHGFLHTFYGALFVGLLVAVLAHPHIRDRLRRLPVAGKLVDRRERPYTLYFASGLLGAWSHTIMDAVLYEDLNPYYSSPMNTFYGMVSGFTLYLIGGVAFLLLVVWILHWYIPEMDEENRQDILEEELWKRLGVLLVASLLLFTVVLETNAPSPMGRMRITGLEINQHSGSSLLLRGTASRLPGIMGDELQVDIVWSSQSHGRNEAVASVFTTASEHVFIVGLSPVEPGDVIIVYLRVSRGDSAVGEYCGSMHIDTASITVPAL